MSKITTVLLMLSISLVDCETADVQIKSAVPPTTYETTHFNLIFAPDLSNRINPDLCKRALSDNDILRILARSLYPSILRHKRAENQLDKFRVDFVNKGQISQFKANTEKMLIDFGQFHNQNDRIAYIMQRAGASRTLQKDTTELKAEFSRIYNLAIHEQSGSDIWSYFHTGLDNKKILPPEPPIRHNNTTYLNNYRNILILTTDGYIEAGIFNKGFDLSQSRINQFRNAFNASGEKDLKTFFGKNPQFRIKPVSNPNLTNLEVLVMEMYDRSLTPAGVARVSPCDAEIMGLFWNDWLKQSGVKRFELHSCAASGYEAAQIIFDFIGIKKNN